MRKNILLTGKPGVGKTTIIEKVIERIGKNKIHGFYTKEIRENNKRTGFRIVTIDGKEGILSHVNLKSRFRIGRYFVNIDDIDEICVKSILDGIENGEWIIIDEIGKMELLSEKFREAVLMALDTKKVLGTVKGSGDEFTDKIKEREDTDVIEVNFDNRDLLVDRLIRKMRLTE